MAALLRSCMRAYFQQNFSYSILTNRSHKYAAVLQTHYSTHNFNINRMDNESYSKRPENNLMFDFKKIWQLQVPPSKKMYALKKGADSKWAASVNIAVEKLQNLESISPQMSIPLLKSMGKDLYNQPLSERSKLFHQMWQSLSELNVERTTEFYNQKYRTQIENNERLIPTEILTELSEAELQPNKHTYQLLIELYTEEGDISGARKVLDQMKEEQIFCDENVYAFLIKGYIRKGEAENVKEILRHMHSLGIQPSEPTFYQMALEYAKQGDVDSVDNVLSRMNYLRKPVFYGKLIAIYSELWNNTEADSAKTILNKYLKMMPEMRHHFLLETCTFIHKNQEEALYGLMEKVVKKNGFFVTYRYNNLVNEIVSTMMSSGWTPRQAFKFTQWFEEKAEPEEQNKRYGHRFSRLQKQCIFEKNLDWYLQFLGLVDQSGLLPHHDCMNMYSSVVQSMLTELSYARNGLLTAADGDQVSALIEDAKLSSSDKVKLKMCVALATGQNEEFSLLAEGVKNHISDSLVGFTILGWQNKKDLESFLSNLWRLCSGLRFPRGRLSYLLVGLADRCDLQQEDMDEIFATLKKMGLRLLLNEQFRGFLKMKGFNTPHYFEIKNTSVVSKEAMENFQQLCVAQDMENAEAALDDLKAQGYIFGVKDLLVYARMHDRAKNLEKVLECRKQMLSLYPDRPMPIFSVDCLAGKRLIAADRFQDALEMLEQSMVLLSGKKISIDQGWKSADLNFFIDACSTGEQMEELTERLVQRFQDRSLFLDIVVKKFLSSHGADTALDKVGEFMRKYDYLPLPSFLIRELAKSDDLDRLQRAVKLAGSVYTEQMILHKLIKAFIEVGKVEEAKKIAQTEGLTADSNFLMSLARYFKEKGHMEKLSNLIDITQHISGLRGLKWFDTTISTDLAETQDWKRLGAMVRSIQGLSTNSLNKVNTTCDVLDLLQKHGQPVLPEMLKLGDVVMCEGSAVQETPEELTVALKNKDLDKVSELLHKFLSEGTGIGTKGAYLLAVYLNTPKDFFRLKMLLKEFARQGDLQTLLLINNFLSLSRANLMHFIAMAAANSTDSKPMENLITYLEENPKELNYSTSVEMYEKLNDRFPQKLTRLEELVLENARKLKEKHAVENLFIYYVTSQQYDKADSLANKVGAFALLGKSCMSVCTHKKDEEGLKYLLEFYKKRKYDSKLCPVYSQLIWLRCYQSDWEGALSFFEMARDDGIEVTKLWARGTLSLQKLLQENNQPVPWEIGTIESNVNKPELSFENSSDSESSSSESEGHS